MYYELYMDAFFLENFCLDFLLLFLTGIAAKLPVRFGRMAAWAKIYVDNIDVLGVYMFTSYSCRRQVAGRRMPEDREETMAVADEAARRRKACGPRT